MRMVLRCIACLLISAAAPPIYADAPVAAAAKPFIHPGLLHSAVDLERVRKNVKNGVEPWAGAWKAFSGPRNRWIARNYKPNPLDAAGRGVDSVGMNNIAGDATAAYYNAVAWSVTGDGAYAKKAVEILDAWASRCRLINGKDAVLCAGIYGYKFVNAAEILRSSYPDWPARNVEQFKTFATSVLLPVVRDFAPFANGNWDAAAGATMISIGVFCDDRALFDRAVRYYLDGAGDGAVLHYVISDTGQLQESGRDQAHAQLGIGMLSLIAEVAWQQGVDLYGVYGNRLLKGFEYTAKYNLGEPVPFDRETDRTGQYTHAKISPPMRLIPIYEMVYNHYVNRAGVPAPFTAKAAGQTRPEGLAIDQVGGGTLLFTRPPEPPEAAATAPPAIPGPVIAKGSAEAIDLFWATAVSATAYTIERALAAEGPYLVLTREWKAGIYRDAAVEAGRVYFYKVSARNAAGRGGDTLPAAACAGLPAPWAQQDVGAVRVKGGTLFDGHAFTLEGAGVDIGGKADQLQFASVPMKGDGSMTVRFVPQTASQSAVFGIAMREAATSDAAHVSLLISPGSTPDGKRAGWGVRLLTRPAAGGDTSVAATSPNLDSPLVNWGRLVAPVWLRLSRHGKAFTAEMSPDGKNWVPVGTTDVVLKENLLAGLCACSHLANVSTMVTFDEVVAPGCGPR